MQLSIVTSAAIIVILLIFAFPAGAYDLGKTAAEDTAACLCCHSSQSAYFRRHPRARKERLSVNETQLTRSAHGKIACIECHAGMSTVPHMRPYAPPRCVRCHAVERGPREKLQSDAMHPLPAQGKPSAVKCTGCHGAHDVRSSKDSSSRVHKNAVNMTCGGCHGQALVDFGGSIHGKSHTRGNRDAAICTDCHGWHIIEWAGGRVPPGSARVIPDTCSRCHANETLSRRHGLDTKKIGSYRESFHGIALRYGDTTVANCASCHGYHRILPSSDPASAIHKSNLARTCGICHPGAGDLLAKGSIHVQPSASQDALVFYIRILYIVLIVGMISGLIALIIIDLRSMLRRRSAFSNVNREAAGRTFERLTLNERIQHFVLAGSFMLLVVTGAPVFLYDSWLFHMIISSDALFRLRGGIHKIAALVLVALAIYHLLYIIFSPRGRREALLMIPRVKDFKDFADLVRFNLGFKDAAPRFGRYNLIHKFEYLAVAWGSLVMILTGFMLWLNVQFTVLLPKWTLDTARAVHGYEATLAFLVIVIWHFYNVHLNPEVFPMSRVWIDGKISEEVMKARHPLEYEELTARGP